MERAAQFAVTEVKAGLVRDPNLTLVQFFCFDRQARSVYASALAGTDPFE